MTERDIPKKQLAEPWSWHFSYGMMKLALVERKRELEAKNEAASTLINEYACNDEAWRVQKKIGELVGKEVTLQSIQDSESNSTEDQFPRTIAKGALDSFSLEQGTMTVKHQDGRLITQTLYEIKPDENNYPSAIAQATLQTSFPFNPKQDINPHEDRER